MQIRRRVNGGEWETLDVEFGVLEDDEEDQRLVVPLEDVTAALERMAGQVKTRVLEGRHMGYMEGMKIALEVVQETRAALEDKAVTIATFETFSDT